MLSVQTQSIGYLPSNLHTGKQLANSSFLVVLLPPLGTGVLQIAQLEKKLEQLKQEKHDYFSRLKKVLHQEDETKKRAQQKEYGAMLSVGSVMVAGWFVCLILRPPWFSLVVRALHTCNRSVRVLSPG